MSGFIDNAEDQRLYEAVSALEEAHAALGRLHVEDVGSKDRFREIYGTRADLDMWADRFWTDMSEEAREGVEANGE